jgi:Chaperone of endosialidase
MTIATSTRKSVATGNGTTKAFPFAYKVFSTADVLVVQAVTATGVETVKSLTTDYTVALNANQESSPGGTVTMLVAPPTGTTLMLASKVVNQQPNTAATSFTPAVLNDALDRATIQIQQLDERLSRSVTLPISGTANTTLPKPAASKVLAWNSAGTGLTYVDAPSVLAAKLAAASGASLVGFQAAGSGAVATTVQNKLQQFPTLLDFMTDQQRLDALTAPAINNSTYDDVFAKAIQSGFPAIEIPTTIKGPLKLTKTVAITSSITFFSEGMKANAPKITGNFNGFLFDYSGTASVYRTDNVVFKGLSLENLNSGSALGTAGIFNVAYAGYFVAENCYLSFYAIGFKLTDAVSAHFTNCCLTGASSASSGGSKQPIRLNNRGYYGGGRNCRISGGIIAGCSIAMDIGGESWLTENLDCEFNDIVLRTGPFNSMEHIALHTETSGMLWTNAIHLPMIPDDATKPWTDSTTNPDEGQGWQGAIKFSGICSYPARVDASGNLVSGNGQAASLFVVKSQNAFTGQLVIDNFAINAAIPTISTSFDRTKPTSVISGLNFVSIASSGFSDPTTIPSDTFANWVRLDGQSGRIKTAKIDNLTAPNLTLGGNVTGGGAYATGFSGLGYDDKNNFIKFASGQTSISAYTSVNLVSTYYNCGVAVDGNPAGAGGTLRPSVDNKMTCGTSTNRWSGVYSATALVTTSDENQKFDIEPSTMGLGFINQLKPVSYKFKESGKLTDGVMETHLDENGVEQTRIQPGSQVVIPGKRVHEGLIAQQVKGVLDAIGVDRAMWVDDEGGQGLRYEEFIGPLVNAVNELTERIKQLEALVMVQRK